MAGRAARKGDRPGERLGGPARLTIEDPSLNRIVLLSGALAAFVYAAHVVVGGLLWSGYSHLMQPISDLTATGAPDRAALQIILDVYSVSALIFGVVASVRLRKLGLKAASWGMRLYLALQVVSLSYGFFPEDLPGAGETFLGTMHIVVTGIIVPFTFGAPIVTGLGLRKAPGLAWVGWFSILCGVLIVFAGSASGYFFVNKLPYFGVVERINIGTLQTWTAVLSAALYRHARPGLLDGGNAVP